MGGEVAGGRLRRRPAAGLDGEHGDDTFKVKDLLPLALSEIRVPLPTTVEAVDQIFSTSRVDAWRGS